MNKVLKIALCLSMILICFLCFCACEKDENSSSKTGSVVKQYITGRYECQAIEWENGTVASGESLQYSESVMGDMYLELFSDGTAQLSLWGQIHDMEFTDTEIHEIGSDYNTYEFSVGSGRATLKDDRATYIFVKK